MENEKYLIKARGAIHITNRVSKLQAQVWNQLLLNAYNDLTTKEVHEINLVELAKSVGIDPRHEDEIKEALNVLNRTQVEWNVIEDDGSKCWGVFTLLAGADLKYVKGSCRYGFYITLREKLFNPLMYAKLKLAIQLKFSSKHSLNLWQICTDYKGIHYTGWIELSLFKKWLGLDGNEYREFKIFNRDVLKPSIEEVNHVSDLYIIPVFKKRGRPVHWIKFLIEEQVLKDEVTEVKSSSSSNQNTTLNEQHITLKKYSELSEQSRSAKEKLFIARFGDDLKFDEKAFAEWLKFHAIDYDLGPDPNCKLCKGHGVVFVENGGYTCECYKH